MVNHRVKGAGKLFVKLNSLMSGLAACWLFGIMFLMTADVLGRVLFNHPVTGTPELVKLSIVGITFLQIPFTLWMGRHIRSDIILGRMSPTGREVTQIITYLCGAAVFIGISVASWSPMINSWSILEYEGEGSLLVPVYPLRTLIVVCSAFTAIFFLFRTIESVLTLYRNQRRQN